MHGGCPKLDDDLDIYAEKIKTLIAEAKIASLTVLTMEVPCCSGLVQIVRKAAEQVTTTLCPIEWKIISIKGAVLQSQKLN